MFKWFGPVFCALIYWSLSAACYYMGETLATRLSLFGLLNVGALLVWGLLHDSNPFGKA